VETKYQFTWVDPDTTFDIFPLHKKRRTIPDHC